MTTIDTSDYYEGTLSGKRTPLPNGEVACGYYRFKDQNTKKWGEPVAIWRQDERLMAKVGKGQTLDITSTEQEHFAKVFSWVARHPVSKAEYWQWRDSGGKWDDGEPIPAEPGVGHNSGATADEVEVYMDLVASAEARLPEFQSVDSDQVSAAAAGLRNRLNEIAGEIDTLHKAEKAPVLERGRAIDAKWLRLRDRAKEAANALRSAMTKWENTKLAREREERRVAEDARRKAEADALASNAPIPAAPESNAEPAKPPPIRTGYGRSAPVREVKVAIIEDQDQVYATLRDNTEVVALLQKLAQRATDAGFPPRGVRIELQRKVA